jgi:uncharacterized metal-binding protein YceD (DUF177 family)
MRIDLQQLREGDQRLTVRTSPDVFDVDDEDWRFEGVITGEMTFHLCDEEILAKGTLHANAVGRCARCLEPVPVAIDAPVNYVYQPQSQEPTDDVAHGHVSPDAPEIAYYGGLVLDPLEQLRESLLLALPAVPHCVACESRRGGPAYSDEPIGEASPDEPEWKRKLRDLSAPSS